MAELIEAGISDWGFDEMIPVMRMSANRWRTLVPRPQPSRAPYAILLEHTFATCAYRSVPGDIVLTT